jgi:5'-nucleotidase
MSPPLLPRILVTNDDGFDAPGLAFLAEAAKTIADEVWIVAPLQDQSGTGQSLTINAPLRNQQRGMHQWAVNGTPSDCVVLGLSHFMKGNAPSLILAGVNAGPNTGDDINFSGTVGAAFTGLMMSVPAMALSLACASRKQMRWETVRALLPDLLANFVREGWDKNTCLSVNLPDLPPEKISGLCWTHPAHKTIQSFRIERREDLREKDYFWLHPHSNHTYADTACDLAALQRGQISVSALTLDRSAPVIATPFGKKTANDE